MNEQELQILLSLLLKLGMTGAEALQTIRSKGVTEEQIAAADLENEISVRDEIQKMKAK